jgi:hypothetical protein
MGSGFLIRAPMLAGIVANPVPLCMRLLFASPLMEMSNDEFNILR